MLGLHRKKRNRLSDVKMLILLSGVAGVLMAAKQPVPIPVAAQMYPGMTGDRMYGEMVRAVADYNITLAVKEACLVKFTTRRVTGGPVFTWTLRCDINSSGAVVHVRPVLGPAETEYLRMWGDDQVYVAAIIDTMWKHIWFDLCGSGCDKNPMASMSASETRGREIAAQATAVPKPLMHVVVEKMVKGVLVEACRSDSNGIVVNPDMKQYCWDRLMAGHASIVKLNDEKRHQPLDDLLEMMAPLTGNTFMRCPTQE